jgi:dihydroorotase
VCDVLTDGKRIAKIAKNIREESAFDVIDASGLTVMAGFVDMHCHLREPGFEYKEDIASGTRAALTGGFTAVACMPNTDPVIDDKSVVRYVLSRAAECDNAKVYCIGAMTKGQEGKILSDMGAMKDEGIVAVSDDGRPVENGNMMRLITEYAETFSLLPISHCECPDIADGGLVNEGLNATITGLKGILRAAEEAMIARDVLLAESLNARIHIAHVSTKTGVAIIRDAKNRGVRVTCETCPHYFSATDDEILSFNTNAKINPPLRGEADVAAIIEGLCDGTIDAIVTDHAPHSLEEKNREFAYAPNGTSGFETAFSLCYTNLVRAGHMDMMRLSRLMSANPSKILRVGGGELRAGETADITIVDPEAPRVVDASRFVSKGKNSLFDGWKLFGAVKRVIVDGVEKEIKTDD